MQCLEGMEPVHAGQKTEERHESSSQAVEYHEDEKVHA